MTTHYSFGSAGTARNRANQHTAANACGVSASSANIVSMTPDRLTVTAELVTATVDTLQALDIPADRIHSLAVQHWPSGTVVQIHIEGDAETAVPLADRVADHYGLPAADDEDRNYTRGAHLGETPVAVYCARPEATS